MTIFILNLSTFVIILEPEAPPSNLSIVATGPMSLFVSWKPVARGFENGEIVQYFLQYYEMATSHDRKNMTFSATVLETNLINLKNWTLYGVEVAAYTKVGRGFVCIEHERTTENGKWNNNFQIIIKKGQCKNGVYSQPIILVFDTYAFI